ncbi:hypothetical protein [Nocardia mexicana]|nr:hypothetical protein [Nocardia mexicana]
MYSISVPIASADSAILSKISASFSMDWSPWSSFFSDLDIASTPSPHG